MARRRRLLVAGSSLALLLGCGVWTGADATPTRPAKASAVPAQHFLTSVSARSSSDIWAVGYTARGTLARHWNGSAWKTFSSPSPGPSSSMFTGVSAAATDDVWAVGSSINYSYAARSLIAHWDGNSWRQVKAPNLAGNDELFGVAAISSSDAWAVGHDGKNSLILHWDGAHWSRVTAPNTTTADRLHGVAAVSASDVWAVGSAGRQTLTLHYNGTGWKSVNSPNTSSKDNVLLGVAVAGANDAWAVGTVSGASKTLALHWNGTAWKASSTPNPSSSENQLLGVSARSANSAWAVGYYCCNGAGGGKTLTLHWNGTGWDQVDSPNPAGGGDILVGVTARRVRGPWAVGDVGESNGGAHVLVLHRSHGAWHES